MTHCDLAEQHELGIPAAERTFDVAVDDLEGPLLDGCSVRSVSLRHSASERYTPTNVMTAYTVTAVVVSALSVVSMFR